MNTHFERSTSNKIFLIPLSLTKYTFFQTPLFICSFKREITKLHQFIISVMYDDYASALQSSDGVMESKYHGH